MKIRFYCYWLQGEESSGNDYYLRRNSLLIDAPESIAQGFNKYLLSALGSDFPAHHPEDCDEVLANIDKFERGELLTYGTGGLGFDHSFTREKVTFEHSIFGECPEWPLWSCTLAQYKAALQGWRKFIDMPKSIDTELIVDLPDGTP